MNEREARFSRQSGFIPTERLLATRATIIGVGAIGRQVALQLAALGVPRLMLVDFDEVDFSNVGSQGYYWRDAEWRRPKVEATREALQQIDPQIVVEMVPERFRSTLDVGEVVFCAVDSISTRAALWRALAQRVQLFVDGRMLGETVRVLAVDDTAQRDEYARTLFSSSEAQAGHCTTRSTNCAASIAAGLMVHQFARWLRGLRVERDITLNLLAAELNVSAAALTEGPS